MQKRAYSQTCQWAKHKKEQIKRIENRRLAICRKGNTGQLMRIPVRQFSLGNRLYIEQTPRVEFSNRIPLERIPLRSLFLYDTTPWRHRSKVSAGKKGTMSEYRLPQE